jgi:hypothetical protein
LYWWDREPTPPPRHDASLFGSCLFFSLADIAADDDGNKETKETIAALISKPSYRGK